MAAICWFSNSTLASASAEITFSLSRSVRKPLMAEPAELPFSLSASSMAARPAFFDFSALKSSVSAISMEFDVFLGRFLQRQKLGQFGDLRAQLPKC